VNNKSKVSGQGWNVKPDGKVQRHGEEASALAGNAANAELAAGQSSVVGSPALAGLARGPGSYFGRARLPFWGWPGTAAAQPWAADGKPRAAEAHMVGLKR
jgi:hypothetical protein